MKNVIHILVVDRENQACKAIAKVIKREARIQIVDFASNGYEAITKAITRMPDAVLMNVSIETEMAGIFACKEINANAPDIKIILYGKECSGDLIFKAFQMGAVNFLIEEYSELELINSILDAIDGKPSIHYSTATRLRKEFKRILDLQDNLIYVINVLVKLTSMEINILKYFYNGMRSQEIAKILFIGNTTMKTHISHILKKFNLETMTQVVEVLHTTELFSMIDPNSEDL